MSLLAEVVCFVSQRWEQKIVEQHFAQTGDRLLAICMYEELDRVLLVVQLSPHTSENEHVDFLRLALQDDTIESYEYVTCSLMSAFLGPFLDRHEQMRSFPLREGESWFPAIDNPNKIYLCLEKPDMATNQTEWLMQHQIRWEFEDF